MTKFTDKKKTVKISMRIWQNGQWSPDFERDFYDVGILPYNEEADVYIVDDVDYIIEQANDWKQGHGDYQDDLEGEPGHTPEDRGLFIESVCV